jgi:hypothetical protein
MKTVFKLTFDYSFVVVLLMFATEISELLLKVVVIVIECDGCT